jgi:hypothetical protein
VNESRLTVTGCVGGGIDLIRMHLSLHFHLNSFEICQMSRVASGDIILSFSRQVSVKIILSMIV